MYNTGCQHACVKTPPGFFQKMVEETLHKDLQDVPDPQKPSGITKGTTDFTGAWKAETTLV